MCRRSAYELPLSIPSNGCHPRLQQYILNPFGDEDFGVLSPYCIWIIFQLSILVATDFDTPNGCFFFVPVSAVVLSLLPALASATAAALDDGEATEALLMARRNASLDKLVNALLPSPPPVADDTSLLVRLPALDP